MTALSLRVAEHPLLELGAFVTELPRDLGELPSPDWLIALLRPDAETPLDAPDDALRTAVRDLLRHGGFKPTGRNKPSAEYLRKAAAEDRLGSINLAVDLDNAASLHSGLPISVVDLDRARPPLSISIAPPDTRYVFNPSGQEIDVSGLVCLFDADGPCANAVKDAQRTKTSDTTRRTLSIVWGTRAAADHVTATTAWYRELTERAGASLHPVETLP